MLLKRIKGYVPLTTKQETRLSRHKEKLRKLAERGVDIRKRRQVLVQFGDGFLTALLVLVAAILSRFLADGAN